MFWVGWEWNVPLRGDSYEPSPFSPPHWNRLPLHPEESNLSEGWLWHAPSCDWVFLAGARLMFSDPAPTSKVKRIKTDEGSRICYEVHIMPRLLILWKVLLLVFQSFSTVSRINSELTNVRRNTIREIKSRRMRWTGHVARMGDSRGIYKVLLGKPEGMRILTTDQGVDWRIILRWIF